MRELEKTQNQLNLLYKYKKCIIRIHFPNRLVLQSVFKTTETISDIMHFIRTYLVDKSLDFYLCKIHLIFIDITYFISSNNVLFNRYYTS